MNSRGFIYSSSRHMEEVLVSQRRKCTGILMASFNHSIGIWSMFGYPKAEMYTIGLFQSLSRYMGGIWLSKGGNA
jgi:hypothetical protein